MDPNSFINQRNNFGLSPNFIVTIIYSLCTLGIAFIVAWVNFQQHRVSKANLKLQLFEKRFKIYEMFQRLHLRCRYLEENISSEEILQFAEESGATPFLFGEEIAEFLSKFVGLLYDYAEANLSGLKQIPKDYNSSQEKKQTKEIARKKLDEHCKSSIKLFGKYLCLKKWI
jgi:hypothetical protein